MKINPQCGRSLILAAALLLTAPDALGQLIHNRVGSQSISDGFSESFGVGFGFRGSNFSFQNGGGPPLLAPFGPPVQPSSIGFANGRSSFRLFGGQSSSRVASSTGVGLTSTNGFPASFSSQTMRPFVTGVIPVVNGPSSFGPYPSAGNVSRQASLANAYQREVESNQRLEKYLRRAASAESANNIRMARANYKLALPIASPPLRAQISNRLRGLGKK